MLFKLPNFYGSLGRDVHYKGSSIDLCAPKWLDEAASLEVNGDIIGAIDSVTKHYPELQEFPRSSTRFLKEPHI